MKEAVGSTWIFTIVITLLLFFTAFVSLSTNYTRTYKIKDEIITILTNKKGVNKNAIRAINEELFDMEQQVIGLQKLIIEKDKTISELQNNLRRNNISLFKTK